MIYLETGHKSKLFFTGLHGIFMQGGTSIRFDGCVRPENLKMGLFKLISYRTQPGGANWPVFLSRFPEMGLFFVLFS